FRSHHGAGCRRARPGAARFPSRRLRRTRPHRRRDLRSAGLAVRYLSCAPAPQERPCAAPRQQRQHHHWTEPMTKSATLDLVRTAPALPDSPPRTLSAVELQALLDLPPGEALDSLL